MAAAPARSMSLPLLLLLAAVVVAAAVAGCTARPFACRDALTQAWEALLRAVFSVVHVRFGVGIGSNLCLQVSESVRSDQC
jgi:Kef-type K+ transport system membrane component KefB